MRARSCLQFLRTMHKKVDASLLQKQHFNKSSPYTTRHLSNSASGISSIIDDAVNVAKDLNEGIAALDISPVIERIENAPLSILGESPFYDKQRNVLVYCDITGKKVFVYNISSDTSSEMEFEQAVGFVIPTSEWNYLSLIVGLENKVVQVNFDTKTIVKDVVSVPPRYINGSCRFNDASCSTLGEIYCGYMNTDWRKGKRGFLFKLNLAIQNVDAKLWTVLDDTQMFLPNGSVTLFDKNREEVFYIVDSGDACIKKLNNNGSVDVIYSLPRNMIDAGYMIDGMTVDSRSNLYVCVPGAGLILIIDPILGCEINRITMPVKKPTAVTFGGPDLSTLYVTTRNEDSSLDPKGSLYKITLNNSKSKVIGSKYANIKATDSQEEMCKCTVA